MAPGDIRPSPPQLTHNSSQPNPSSATSFEQNYSGRFFNSSSTGILDKILRPLSQDNPTLSAEGVQLVRDLEWYFANVRKRYIRYIPIEIDSDMSTDGSPVLLSPHDEDPEEHSDMTSLAYGMSALTPVMRFSRDIKNSSTSFPGVGTTGLLSYRSPRSGAGDSPKLAYRPNKYATDQESSRIPNSPPISLKSSVKPDYIPPALDLYSRPHTASKSSNPSHISSSSWWSNAAALRTHTSQIAPLDTSSTRPHMSSGSDQNHNTTVNGNDGMDYSVDDSAHYSENLQVGPSRPPVTSAGYIKSQYKPHQCPHCTMTTTRAYDLQRHIDSVHFDGKDYKLSCENCGRPFSRQDGLNRHITNSNACKKYRKAVVDHSANLNKPTITHEAQEAMDVEAAALTLAQMRSWPLDNAEVPGRSGPV